MAEINDQLIINYVNEHLRPLAESLRDEKSYMDDAAAYYQSEISAALGAWADTDKISRDGLPVVTKADIAGLISIFASLKTVLETGSNMDDIRQFVVRPLRG